MCSLIFKLNVLGQNCVLYCLEWTIIENNGKLTITIDAKIKYLFVDINCVANCLYYFLSNQFINENVRCMEHNFTIYFSNILFYSTINRGLQEVKTISQ